MGGDVASHLHRPAPSLKAQTCMATLIRVGIILPVAGMAVVATVITKTVGLIIKMEEVTMARSKAVSCKDRGAH